MATYNQEFTQAHPQAPLEPTETQLAKWDDDGGNQYLYSGIIFINGKIMTGRAAHLHQIITKYWEQLSRPIHFKELTVSR